ncbi:MAG: hypothetical protein IV100_16915 [Myxococcales bacterium]|nr:hypothetical protein [Myxococcales bacterium]
MTAGLAVEVAVVNEIGFADSIGNLTAKGTFPVFQDSAEAGVWLLHGAGKDDMIVYTPEGKVSAFLDYGGPVPTSLSTPEGWAAVKAAWTAALTP